MTAWRSTTPDRPVEISIDGKLAVANEGEPLVASLVIAGKWCTRKTRTGAPRGPFCFIGMCQECIACVDGQRNVRSCQVVVTAGLLVKTFEG